jgi:hypothetical protein
VSVAITSDISIFPGSAELDGDDPMILRHSRRLRLRRSQLVLGLLMLE